MAWDSVPGVWWTTICKKFEVGPSARIPRLRLGVFYVKDIKTLQVHIYCSKERVMLHCFSIHNSEHLRVVFLISQQQDKGFRLLSLDFLYWGVFVSVCRTSKILTSLTPFQLYSTVHATLTIILRFRNKDIKIDCRLHVPKTCLGHQ